MFNKDFNAKFIHDTAIATNNYINLGLREKQKKYKIGAMNKHIKGLQTECLRF